MSKRIIFSTSAIICLSALLITGATYLVTDKGQSLSCTPVNPGPLAELQIGAQIQHGFPQWFYEEAFPPNCQSLDVNSINAQGIDTNTSSQFRLMAVMQDFVVWFAVSTIAVGIFIKIRGRHGR
jgi:hypothetical protein